MSDNDDLDEFEKAAYILRDLAEVLKKHDASPHEGLRYVAMLYKMVFRAMSQGVPIQLQMEMHRQIMETPKEWGSELC